MSQGSILDLELFTVFSSVADGDTEAVFVSFADGTEVAQIAYLVGKSRFTIIQHEGPN